MLSKERHQTATGPLLGRLQNRLAREQWAVLTKYRDKEFTEYVSSVARRLFTLMANPVIGSTFSQVEATIDLRSAMDCGEILLFDLRDTAIFDGASAQLFGLLLISSLFGQSKLRSNTNPYFLYIDESHRFLSGSNLAEIFEECRKYGLHMVLAHQNLGQLRDASERVFSTVVNEAEVKAVFSIKEPEDAAYLVRLLYRGGMIDPARVKDVLTRPTVVGYSIGYLEGQSQSESSVTGSGRNAMAGSAISLTPDGGMLTSPTELGQMSSESSSDVQSRAKGQSTTTSKAQTLMPVLEERAGGTWPIEEQIFMLADDLASLPVQHGVLSIGGRINMKFRALDAPDEHVSSLVFKQFLERLKEDNPYLAPVQDVPIRVPEVEVVETKDEPDFLE